MKEIVIRNAKAEDAQSINQILYINRTTSYYYKEIFGEHVKKCTTMLEKDSIDKKIDQIKNLDDQQFFVVAKNLKSKKIIGICSGSLHSQSTEMKDIIKDINDYAEIKSLYIDPQYHSQGIGSQLIKKFEKRVSEKQGKRIIIKTLSNNIQSNGFYKKHGYIITPYQCTFTRRDITTTCNIYIKSLNE